MRPRYWVAFSLIVVVAIALFWAVPSESSGQNKASDAGQGQPKWEYKIVRQESSEENCNALGEEGWELVAVTAETRAATSAAGSSSGGSTPPAFYFKRRK